MHDRGGADVPLAALPVFALATILASVPALPITLRVYAGRRVLVTGASGFIGRAVAQWLNGAAAEILLTGRNSSALEAAARALPRKCEVLPADLGEPGSFVPLLRRACPHIVFHLAGYGVDPAERDPALAERMNHGLVEEVAGALAAEPPGDWPGLRFVHVGSAAEFGAVAGQVTEDTPTEPVNLYGRTKLAGTRAISHAVESRGLRAMTARLFTVYGPGEHSHRLLPSLLEAACSGERLHLTRGEQLRDFTYVGDVAEGLLRLGCLTGSAPALVNLCTGKLTSVRHFAKTAAEVLGIRPDRLEFGALPYRGDETPQGPADTSRFERLLGWKPETSVREGIRLTAEARARGDAAPSPVPSGAPPAARQ